MTVSPTASARPNCGHSYLLPGSFPAAETRSWVCEARQLLDLAESARSKIGHLPSGDVHDDWRCEATHPAGQELFFHSPQGTNSCARAILMSAGHV